jgi:hypothetical protein
VLGKVVVATLRRLELAAIDGNNCLREELKVAAYHDEAAAYIANAGAIAASELGMIAGRFANAIPSLIPSGKFERDFLYRHNRNAAQRSSCSKALAMRAIPARLQPTS